MAAVEGHRARRGRADLDWLVDGNERNAFACGVNDHAPASERRDNFVVLVLGLRGQRSGKPPNEENRQKGKSRETPTPDPAARGRELNSRDHLLTVYSRRPPSEAESDRKTSEPGLPLKVSSCSWFR
jgi:hypothetical protein